MILNKDTHPTRNFYYIGALVIKILASEKSVEVDVFKTYQKLRHTEEVGINVFMLTLNWLFLLNLIGTQKGKIVKCF